MMQAHTDDAAAMKPTARGVQWNGSELGGGTAGGGDAGGLKGGSDGGCDGALTTVYWQTGSWAAMYASPVKLLAWEVIWLMSAASPETSVAQFPSTLTCTAPLLATTTATASAVSPFWVSRSATKVSMCCRSELLL